MRGTPPLSLRFGPEHLCGTGWIEFEKLWRQADSKSVPRARRFPSPWNIEQVPGGYVVKDATGQALAYVHGHEKHTDAKTVKVLSMDEARQIAAQYRQAT